MPKFILIQDNINGFFLETLPEASLIVETNRDRAVELVEFLGVDFQDFCECCGSRWSLEDYKPEWHSYLGPIPELTSWVQERAGN
jgi:hypothetical protein